MPPYNITQTTPFIKRIHFKIDFHSHHFPMYIFFLFYHGNTDSTEIKEAIEKIPCTSPHF